jgi:hypothetical protein
VADELKRAIDALYAAFATPPPPVIEGCPCCINTRNVDVLLSKPLRELTGDELWRYVSGVFLTIGGTHDFRYLFPRIFEIAIVDPNESNCVEIVLSKLRLADWSSWSATERASVERLLNAWFGSVLTQAEEMASESAFDPSYHLDGLLCGLAYGGVSLAPFLDQLRQPRYVAVVEDLRAQNTDEDTGRLKLSNAFWDGHEDAGAPLLALLMSGRTH